MGSFYADVVVQAQFAVKPHAGVYITNPLPRCPVEQEGELGEKGKSV